MGEGGTLKIWHKIKHDDYTVSEITCLIDPQSLAKRMEANGGFWQDSYFVPWHNISYIEFVPPVVAAALAACAREANERAALVADRYYQHLSLNGASALVWSVASDIRDDIRALERAVREKTLPTVEAVDLKGEKL